MPAATVLRETEVKVRAIDRTAGLNCLQRTRAPEMPAPPDIAAALQAPLAELLASGGDGRIAPDPVTGLNKYLCGTTPVPGVVAYASCTASTPSPAALRAAEQCRQRLAAQAQRLAPGDVLADEAEAIGTRLLRHWGVDDLAAALLAPSGTDATLLLMGLLAAESPGAPIASVLCAASETGGGVPLAAAGRHFAPISAGGVHVPQGQTVSGFSAGMETHHVALRAHDGRHRPAGAVDADYAALVQKAAARGRVAVHVIEGSKTGLSAPSRACIRAIQARYPDSTDIVVDACQARLGPRAVRAYLLQGWPVLVTGSKFFGGPPFCGALLFPQQRLERIFGSSGMPHGLQDYVGANPGLLLRWTAALHEMERFGAVPDPVLNERMRQLGTAIRRAITHHPALALAEGVPPAGENWAEQRSVFTFAVRDQHGGFLPQARLQELYRALAQNVGSELNHPLGARRFLIGQPVGLGEKHGGLRIAIGARTLTDNFSIAAHESDLQELFQKLTLLCKHTLVLANAAE